MKRIKNFSCLVKQNEENLVHSLIIIFNMKPNVLGSMITKDQEIL